MLSRDLVVFLLVSGTFSLLSLYFTWHLATNYPQDPLNNLIGSRAYLVGLGTHFIFCLGLGYFWTGHLGFVILASVGSELGEWLILRENKSWQDPPWKYWADVVVNVLSYKLGGVFSSIL